MAFLPKGKHHYIVTTKDLGENAHTRRPKIFTRENLSEIKGEDTGFASTIGSEISDLKIDDYRLFTNKSSQVTPISLVPL